MDIEMEIQRANSFKTCRLSEEERLRDFKEWMDYELSLRLVPEIDSPVKHIPEEVVEYIGDINEFIRDTETEKLPEYGYMKK